MAGTAAAGVSIGRVGSFAWAYLRSMRLYYGFVTLIAGWIGLSFAHFLYPDLASPATTGAVLAILFLGWGVNQIINDYLGRAEDRVNAPHRPMVTGELNPHAALAVSGVLIAASAAATWLLSPWALVPFLLGISLNVLYEHAKGVPLLGNVVFGLMIATCTAYGYLAAGAAFDLAFTSSRLGVLFLVALMNGLMTYYTYFKDHDGDRSAGKITAVVLQGIERSRVTAIAACFLPSLALWALLALGTIDAPLNAIFLFLAAVTLFLQAWTGVLYFRHPTGPRAYFSLATNFRACTCGQVTLIALFNPVLALVLYVATYVFVGFLFNLHGDPKA
ncbi:MAG: UbiA family prenyltransferase [Planctomycetota bacterium]|jgi:geranylgeranylglycerol-phosphate geranylgeranyltransferase